MIAASDIVTYVKGWSGVVNASATIGNDGMKLVIESHSGTYGVFIGHITLATWRKEELETHLAGVKATYQAVARRSEASYPAHRATALYEEISQAAQAMLATGVRPTHVMVHPSTRSDLVRDLRPDLFDDRFGAEPKLLTRSGTLVIVDDAELSAGNFTLR